tara:strand:+ start:62150 stop:63886 length:1737 start_codon:yes stop_codon:yes gene_type:complete
MVISTGAATVLLGGLMSTIVVANRAWSPDLKPAIKTEASGLTRQLSIDLRSALRFTERTAKAATFTVPDRDSDGRPEVLRYAWSGTSGEPLTVSVNGGTAQVVITDVQTFNMDYLLRSVTAPVIPVSGQSQTVVYISEADAGNGGEVNRNELSSEDQQRIVAIESWDFAVSVVSGYASDTDWAAAIDKAAAIYVPGSVEDDEISQRLYYANVGVVFETSSLRDDSGFGNTIDLSSTTDIDLENTHHYITSTLSAGQVKIVKSSQPLMFLKPGFGPDLQVLARGDSKPYMASLAVIESHGRTLAIDAVPGRRVLLPWGASSTPFDLLTDAARTIMERSISWAAGLDSVTSPQRILFLVDKEFDLKEEDFDRKLMFESAGFEVRPLNQETESNRLSNEIAESEAIYLSSNTNPDILLSSIYNVQQGVMCDSKEWNIALGFSSDSASFKVSKLAIVDSEHEIVSGFKEKSLTIVTDTQETITPSGTAASGLTTVLGISGSSKGAYIPVVATLERGVTRVDETVSPGRRTLAPTFKARREHFTANGYRLMQQAMVWTASAPPAPETSFSSSSFSQFLQGLNR